jgi:hypothetical protein
LRLLPLHTNKKSNKEETFLHLDSFHPRTLKTSLKSDFEDDILRFTSERGVAPTVFIDFIKNGLCVDSRVHYMECSGVQQNFELLLLIIKDGSLRVMKGAWLWRENLNIQSYFHLKLHLQR